MKKRLFTVGIASFALSGSLLAAPPALAEPAGGQSVTAAASSADANDHRNGHGKRDHRNKHSKSKYKRHKRNHKRCYYKSYKKTYKRHGKYYKKRVYKRVCYYRH